MPHARILVVDDDPTSRMGLEQLLRHSDFEVMTAADGAEALEIARASLPDVVVTDVQMPGTDGVELCRRLHAEVDADIPVILISGSDDRGSVVGGLRAGAQDFLMKPLDFEQLLVMVQRAIERRAACVERDQLRVQAETLCQQALAALRARDDVLSVVSHDLRGPLSVARLCAEKLGGERRDEERNLLAMSLVRSCHKMERLVGDLLAQAQLGAGRIALDCNPHLVSTILADVNELRPLALEKGLGLKIAPLPDDFLVSCDRGRIMQVFSNLIGNAVKFTPRGGTITLSVRRDTVEAHFTVRDDGPGIPAEARARIFDRYWQVRPGDRAGVGLGLFISQRILEGHGGRIWVDSELGVGSTFEFTIPCVAAMGRMTADFSQPSSPLS